MATSVTLNPAVTNVTVASASAISVDLTTSTTTVNVTSGLLPQNLSTSDSPTFAGLTVNAITASQTMQLITGSTTSVNTTDFLSYAGKRLMVTTSGAITIDLPNSVAADAGKTWVIMNASNNEITLDVDNNGTTQYFRILTGGSVITPYLGQNVSHLKITKGGIAELVCLGAGNDISVPSYLIFGSGVHYE